MGRQESHRFETNHQNSGVKGARKEYYFGVGGNAYKKGTEKVVTWRSSEI